LEVNFMFENIFSFWGAGIFNHYFLD